MTHVLYSDLAIIGGGMGGIAAALAALSQGRRVVMTEAYAWIGGQVTSQAVPPDEHLLIETLGTRTYLAWRERVRDYYRRNYPLRKEAREDPMLNPGLGTVSRLCHEPKVSHAVFRAMLDPYISLGDLVLLTEAVPVAAETDGRRVTSVTVKQYDRTLTIHAPYIIDATETGDLLPLTDTAYVTGKESREDTGERHAAPEADPLDMQAVTWCFAVSRDHEGRDHTIPKPADYDHYAQHLSAFWPGSQLSWTYTQPITLEPIRSGIEPAEGTVDLWRYRRIFAAEHYERPDFEDITLINWPQNDYWFGPLYDVPADEARQHLEAAKEISRCWLYWMQTEAPRPDGGRGYPDLYLRGDALGTEDGFAMAPYIRESRRILGLTRITEADVGAEMRRTFLDEGTIDRLEARPFDDSVGIGYYRIDLHPTAKTNYLDIESLPFQIPLGALIPKDKDNLLAGNKNISTTHITNGCYRLHPVEWNIGEACGHLVAYCLDRNVTPHDVHGSPDHLQAYQHRLEQAGIHLSWPEDQRAGLHR